MFASKTWSVIACSKSLIKQGLAEGVSQYKEKRHLLHQSVVTLQRAALPLRKPVSLLDEHDKHVEDEGIAQRAQHQLQQVEVPNIGVLDGNNFNGMQTSFPCLGQR